MSKQMAVEQIDRIRAKIAADANHIGVGRATILMNDLDVLRTTVIGMLDDDDEDDCPVVLSPSLITALEARGFRQGEGNPPGPQDLLDAIADVLKVPGAQHLKEHEDDPADTE